MRSSRSLASLTGFTPGLPKCTSRVRRRRLCHAHFIYLWTESTPVEQRVLSALDRRLPLTGQLTPTLLVAYLNQWGQPIETPALREALQRLVAREVLSRAQLDDEMYCWRLGLFAGWVDRHRQPTSASQ